MWILLCGMSRALAWELAYFKDGILGSCFDSFLVVCLTTVWQMFDRCLTDVWQIISVRSEKRQQKLRFLYADKCCGICLRIYAHTYTVTCAMTDVTTRHLTHYHRCNRVRYVMCYDRWLNRCHDRCRNTLRRFIFRNLYLETYMCEDPCKYLSGLDLNDIYIILAQNLTGSNK